MKNTAYKKNNLYIAIVFYCTGFSGIYAGAVQVTYYELGGSFSKKNQLNSHEISVIYVFFND